MKVYIVIEISNDKEPKVLNVYKNRKDAEKEAYKDVKCWRNIIERELRWFYEC